MCQFPHKTTIPKGASVARAAGVFIVKKLNKCTHFSEHFSGIGFYLQNTVINLSSPSGAQLSYSTPNKLWPVQRLGFMADIIQGCKHNVFDDTVLITVTCAYDTHTRGYINRSGEALQVGTHIYSLSNGKHRNSHAIL